MNIPRELIYEERFSLEDFEIDEEKSLDCAFYDLLQKVERLPQHMGEDLETTYLHLFNDAYYIATSVLTEKRPELKFDIHKQIAGEDIISPNARVYSEDSVRGFCVLSMVWALLNDIDHKTKSLERYLDKLRSWLNEDEDKQRIMYQLSCDPFTQRKAPNLSPRAIKPTVLVGVKWDNIITIFNKQGEFQKSQVAALVNTLGKEVDEKVYIIDSIVAYINKMEEDELPF